jgi:dTDP-4-amino-4,6-dideoxygalactose transaminase
VLPTTAGDAHVFHVYAVRARRRDALAAHLARAGVATQVYYRTPLHRQPALADVALVPLPLPEAERAAAEVLALPIYPELTREQVARVAAAVAAFYRNPTAL